MPAMHGACILYPVIFDRVVCATLARGDYFPSWSEFRPIGHATHARGLADLLLEEFFLMSSCPRTHGASWLGGLPSNQTTPSHTRGLPLAGSTDFRGSRSLEEMPPMHLKSDALCAD